MTFALLSIITALVFFHRQCRVVLCQCSGPPFLSDGMPRTGITEEEFRVADECRGIRNAGGKSVSSYLHVQIYLKRKTAKYRQIYRQ